MSLPAEIDPLPANYGWGKVTGRAIYAIADTAEDTDDKPQARPAVGKVNFIPKETFTKTPSGAAEKALVMHATVTANLSSTGRILDAEGRNGVWLTLGVWTAQFELTGGGRIPQFDFEVTAEHTDAAPLDLADVAPYVPPGSVQVTTLIVPTGAADGQVLSWLGGQLVWGIGGVSEATLSAAIATRAPAALVPQVALWNATTRTFSAVSPDAPMVIYSAVNDPTFNPATESPAGQTAHDIVLVDDGAA